MTDVRLEIAAVLGVEVLGVEVLGVEVLGPVPDLSGEGVGSH
jgi:hypothetical protein